jgi:small subunit ribosomal protein S17
MPEEEKNAETEGQEPEEAPEAAEEPAAEEAAPEEAAPEETAPEEPAEEPAAEAPPAEEPEVLGPKQRRKLERSRASGPAKPERSAEDRASDRTALRRSRAAARSRWRKKSRAKSRDRKSGDSDSRIAGPGRDEVAGAPGKRKVRQGVVVSDKGDKTITVRIDRVGRHRVYGKVVHSTGTLHAHDEQNEAGTGDTVRIVECRPLSRTKRWRLVEILQKAK